MVDGLKLAKYLHDSGLKIQEFWFLYCIMNSEDNFREGKVKVPQTEENLEFNDYIKRYFKDKSPEIDGGKWSAMAYHLELEGWLEIYQEDRTGKLSLRNCFVTDQFKAGFLISDAMVAFAEFLAIYPSRIEVNGRRYVTCDQPPETLAEKYNDLILRKGNRLLHERCLLVTGMFVDENDGNALYKISEYFLRYEAIAMGYEGKEIKPKRSTTGRKAV